MISPGRISQVFLLVVVASGLSESASAASLSDIAESLAKDVKSILQQHKLNLSVTVDAFEFNAFGASSGSTVGIQDKFQRALRAQMIGLDGKDVTVSGRVTTNEYVLAVSCQVFDVSANRKYTVSFRGAPSDNSGAVSVTDREDIIGVLAPTFESDLEPENPSDRRVVLDDDFEAAVDSPDCHIDGSSVFATKNGRFGIQVLVRDTNGKYTRQPRVESVDGEAFVHLQKDEEIAVRIINRAEYDVGAKLLVDGLNAFVFATEEKYRDGGIYLIRRLGSQSIERAQVITGWFLDLNREAAFNITSVPDGAAARLNRTSSGKVGTLSVLFFPSWNEHAGEKPPVDALGGRRQTKGLAVGTGQIQSANLKARPENKFAKTVISAITVRYDRPTR